MFADEHGLRVLQPDRLRDEGFLALLAHAGSGPRRGRGLRQDPARRGPCRPAAGPDQRPRVASAEVARRVADPPGGDGRRRRDRRVDHACRAGARRRRRLRPGAAPDRPGRDQRRCRARPRGAGRPARPARHRRARGGHGCRSAAGGDARHLRPAADARRWRDRVERARGGHPQPGARPASVAPRRHHAPGRPRHRAADVARANRRLSPQTGPGLERCSPSAAIASSSRRETGGPSACCSCRPKADVRSAPAISRPARGSSQAHGSAHEPRGSGTPGGLRRTAGGHVEPGRPPRRPGAHPRTAPRPARPGARGGHRDRYVAVDGRHRRGRRGLRRAADLALRSRGPRHPPVEHLPARAP